MSTLPSSVQPSNLTPKQQLWPEPLGQNRRSGRFPTHLFIWLVPGFIGILVFTVFFLVLEARSNRQIIYFSPDLKLSMITADQDDQQTIGPPNYRFSSPIFVAGSQPLRLLGVPQWSPTENSFAATIHENEKIQVALFESQTEPPILIDSSNSEFLALPANSWSPNGHTLALIEHGNNRSSLLLFDLLQSRVTPVEVTLDTRVGFDWFPDSSQLLLTTREENTPKLQILNLTGSITDFEPDDNKKMRADGAWSPDGTRVVYVASSSYNNETAFPLFGEIWVASSDGNTAYRIAEGMNLAPVWSPEGEYIFFLRYLPEQDTFDLYRINTDGNAITKIGPVADSFVLFPFDRGLFLGWAADGQRLFFLSNNDSNSITVYTANGKGENPEPLSKQCDASDASGANWHPSSSLLLVSCSSGNSFLHLLEEETELPNLPFSTSLTWSVNGEQILFLTPDGELSLMESSGNNVRYPGDRTYQLDFPLMIYGRQPLQLLGAPQWSSNGDHIAITATDNESKVEVLLFDADGTNPVHINPTFDLIALPSNGWSSEGDYLALVEHDGNRSLVSIIDLARAEASAFDLSLDTRAGLSWHPDQDKLLITARDNGVTPTLYVLSTEGTETLLMPEDSQTFHADAVWSPNGKQIAYVAGSTFDTYGLTPLLTGKIWLTDSQGQNPQQIVVEGQNFAPVWDPKGNFLFFNRYDSETAQFELYRIRPDGSSLTRIGSSTAAFAELPYDRSLYIGWSQNGRKMFYVSSDPQGNNNIVYHADYDGTDSQVVPTSCTSRLPFVVQWAPTSRALLIGCPSGEIFLQWVERRQDSLLFANGLLPAWEP